MSREKYSANQGELERTLGLGPALAIGIGTMVGAGIFVFPGIAGGDAGPAAMLSFLIAGSIAMIVALCTAELATAMPESGGGYYFASRIFGPFVGTLIGIGQCIGLIFASAFYLVGFGEYTSKIFTDLGISLGDPITLLAFGTAIVLIVINLIGTRGVGKFQNGVVIILTGILTALFGYGALDALGVIGNVQLPEEYIPKGYTSIFTTTALIFTSYLGFVQIATVAGEIKNPQKNLPRALIGSVAIVTLLYILTLFVSTSIFNPKELAEFGETATVEVMRSIIGPYGGVLVLGAGLLATLSSANASILSSSRAIYALSTDTLIPSKISTVNKKFGTPHWALFLVGVSIMGVTLFGSIELLAEVASLLHLVLYGIICVALYSVRKKSPIWYVPTFRVKAVTVVTLTGAITCFGLIAFMQTMSILIGAIILSLASLWYWVFARNTTIANPQPPHIKPSARKPKILIPINISDPEKIPEELLRPFRDLEINLLWYKLVKEQTSPQQSREELDEEERERMTEVSEQVKKYNYLVETDQVFTPDLGDSIDRYIDEEECNAVLTVESVPAIERLLVPIYSKDQLNKRLSTILHDLSKSSDLPVTLINLSSKEGETESENREENLEFVAKSLLREAGLDNDRIFSKSVNVDDVTEAVEQISGEDDLIILGETGSSDRKSFFNTVHNKISETVSCPVLSIINTEGKNAQ